MYTSTEVHGVQGSERFLFCTHWLNPLVFGVVMRGLNDSNLASFIGN